MRLAVTMNRGLLLVAAVLLRTNGLSAAQSTEAKASPGVPSAPAAESPKLAAGPTNCPTLRELRRRLGEIIEQNKYAPAIWGVKVGSLDTGKTLFEHIPQKLFSPASNSKLFTVALALDRFGPDYRLKTSLYSKTKPDEQGTIPGDLVIYGRGDPTINARLHGGELDAALAPFVAALTKAGVKRIAGDLIGDDSYFRGPPFGSGWAWDDLEYSYGAEVSALTINDNLVQLSVHPGERVGAPCQTMISPSTTLLSITNRTRTVEKGRRRSIRFFRPLDENVLYVSGELPLEDSPYNEEIAMHAPAQFFASFLREALARQGITLSGRTRAVNWLDREVEPIARDQMVELGQVESAPLRELAAEIMKPSQNLYTDLLLAHVGEKTREPGSAEAETSEQLGILELGKFLTQAGINRNEIFFEEGSGLSRNNLVTPNAVVTLLRFMSRHSAAEVFRQALPVAGIDGTLRNRMRGTVAAGNVRAKTGTLRWANSLSGYVTTAAGERLVFSIMLNRFHNSEPGSTGRADVDELAILLAGFTGRSDER